MKDPQPVKFTTEQLLKDFEVLAFCYGLCMVKRKSDGVEGTFRFDHMPRRYYGFVEELKR